jgi:hypothetical protein
MCLTLKEEEKMARITRRKYFAVFRSNRDGGNSRLHRAPVFAQANTVHILRWNDFVPAADKVLREVYAPEVQKALGLKLNVETVNANDIPARATSSIQSGSGPDIFMLLKQLSAPVFLCGVDVSAIADEVGKAQGGSTTPVPSQLNQVGANGYPCPGRSSQRRSSTASPGSTKSAPSRFRRPGRSITRSARS